MTVVPGKEREIQSLIDENVLNRKVFNQKVSDLQFTVNAKVVEIEQLKGNIIFLNQSLMDLFEALEEIRQESVSQKPEQIKSHIDYLKLLKDKLHFYELELEEKNRKLQIYESRIKLMEFQNRRLKEQVKDYEDNVAVFENALRTVDELKSLIRDLETKIRYENDSLEDRIKTLYGRTFDTTQIEGHQSSISAMPAAILPLPAAIQPLAVDAEISDKSTKQKGDGFGTMKHDHRRMSLGSRSPSPASQPKDGKDGEI